MVEHNKDPSKRIAQRRLARDALEIVHGEEEMKSVEAQHGLLFARSKTSIKKEIRAAKPDIKGAKRVPSKDPNAPPDMNPLLNKFAGPAKHAPAGQKILPRSMVVSQQISRVLYAAGLVASRSEGHRLMAAGGAYIGSCAGPVHTEMPDHVEFTPVKNWEDDYINKFIVNNGLLILRAGKWRVRVIKIVEDEEFERLGLDVPGWKEVQEKKQQRAELEEHEAFMETGFRSH